jgi:hypothetical protein
MKNDPQTDTEEFIVLEDAIAHVKYKVEGGYQVAIIPVDCGWTVSTPKRADDKVSA